MREYIVAITRSDGTAITIPLFALTRKDAIDFVKRNNRAAFNNKTYKRIAGAKLKEQARAA